MTVNSISKLIIARQISGGGGGGVEGVGRHPLIRQKCSKKVQFFTLALGEGPQSTKKTSPWNILVTGLIAQIKWMLMTWHDVRVSYHLLLEWRWHYQLPLDTDGQYSNAGFFPLEYTGKFYLHYYIANIIYIYIKLLMPGNTAAISAKIGCALLIEHCHDVWPSVCTLHCVPN